LTQDHLGSPRIITDNVGKVIARKDFSAFGDETSSAQRTELLGYKPEEVRQDYTGYQKDDESGLEFAQARYYNNKHGRFTSVDPLTASANVKDPQTFNRYSYAMNSPYKFTDPLGLVAEGSDGRIKGFNDTFENRMENGVTEKQDYDLMVFHVSNGTALGYAYQNRVEALQAREDSQTQQSQTQETQSNQHEQAHAQQTQTQDDVTVSATLDDPLLTDSLGYSYITYSDTGNSNVPGAFNCMAFGLGSTNKWSVPTSGETIEEFALRNGATRWYLGQSIPKGFTLMKTFEDPDNSRNWHVMRRMGKGDWWSKNGGGFVYVNIKDPDKFYRDQYGKPKGNVDMKFFLVPKVPIVVPRRIPTP
jgi:RHS repeat-associated protein